MVFAIPDGQFIVWEHYHSFISTTKKPHSSRKGPTVHPSPGALHQKRTCAVSLSISAHLSGCQRKVQAKDKCLTGYYSFLCALKTCRLQAFQTVINICAFDKFKNWVNFSHLHINSFYCLLSSKFLLLYFFFYCRGFLLGCNCWVVPGREQETDFYGFKANPAK